MVRSLRHLAFAAVLLAGLSASALAQTVTGWSLVWADEFAQPDGTPPDASTWSFDVGGGGWGNNELETYTSRTNNCRVEGGMLVIEARKENYTGTDGILRNYTSSRIKTKGKKSWAFGRIEARIKIPRGQGLWPAFWMLGANFDTAGWPTCGEIDIMENVGYEPAIVHGTIHGPGYSGDKSIGGPYPLGSGAFADDFHIFAVEWETNRIRWYVDDQLYFTATPARLPSGGAWVFNAPEFIILNVAVGGYWPGSPNASTSFPQRMTVDYVRVYSQTNLPACGGNKLANAGFEAGGLADWTSYGAGFNTSIASSNAAPPHAGTNVFKVFGQFNSADNYSGIYQDKSCAPGDVFTAGGWMLSLTSDRIAGSNAAWYEVSFRDGSGNMLALYRSALVNVASPADTWLRLDVTHQVHLATGAVVATPSFLTAPPGTVFVRGQIVFRQPPGNSAGSVFVDDLELGFAAPTYFPVSLRIRQEPGQIGFSFPTFLGTRYQVQTTASLTEPWQVRDTLAGTGATLTVNEAAGASTRFFRVIRICN